MMAIRFIEMVTLEIRHRMIPIGHLKFLVKGAEISHKISFTTILEEDWKNFIPDISLNSVQIMVNSRLETSPEQTSAIVKDCLAAILGPGILVSEGYKQAFKPGFPNPTHRFSNEMLNES